jgi:hypothetical protein
LLKKVTWPDSAEGKIMKFICVVVLSIVLSSACSNGGSGGSEGTLDSAVPPVKNGNWYKPSVSATWQWQLAGTVTTTYPVEIYHIDLFDVADPGNTFAGCEICKCP